MTDQDDNIIEVRPAPLSHLSEKKQSAIVGLGLDRRIVGVAVAVVVVILGAFVFAPTSDTPSSTTTTVVTSAPTSAPAKEQDSPDQLAPFAQTQKQIAREKAQETLAQFVEKQIYLQENMQVELWGEQALNAALDLAKRGDAEFVQEAFDDAIATYTLAADELDKVISLGEAQFQQHLTTAKTHIAAFEHLEASREIQAALGIKPENQEAQDTLTRVEKLPNIINMLRTAKNHELSFRFDEALALYDQVFALDPNTTGLSDLRQQAAQAQAGNTVNALLGTAFGELEQQQFDQARATFNRVLQMEPANDIAKGGLQQVAQANDLAIIRRYERSAADHIADEAWQQAINDYESVLKLDNNIQFAKTGLSVAKSHQRTQRLLQRIVDQPQKLSSQRLYLDAEEILKTAQQLSAAGPRITQLATQVAELLTIYRDPVDVVLLSDNATEVIMSNVGALGNFERKTLTLRPGAYTIRGSQNGCRDILLNIEVLPGIEPLDVRCQERLQR